MGECHRSVTIVPVLIFFGVSEEGLGLGFPYGGTPPARHWHAVFYVGQGVRVAAWGQG